MATALDALMSEQFVAYVGYEGEQLAKSLERLIGRRASMAKVA